jgi:hypothetical protein
MKSSNSLVPNFCAIISNGGDGTKLKFIVELGPWQVVLWKKFHNLLVPLHVFTTLKTQLKKENIALAHYMKMEKLLWHLEGFKNIPYDYVRNIL